MRYAVLAVARALARLRLTGFLLRQRHLDAADSLYINDAGFST